MTNTELKGLVNKSPQADSYKKAEFKFDFPYLNYSQTFIGLPALFTFVNQQIKGWESIEEKIPTELANSIIYFTNVRESITNYATNYLHQDLPGIEPYISSIIQQIQQIHILPFLYSMPEVDFLQRVNLSLPNSFQSAYSVIVGTFNYPSLNSKDNLIGVMMAYEFIQKDKSEILTRRNAEKKSIESLRQDFTKYISEAEKETAEQFENSEKNYTEQVESIEKIKSEKSGAIDQWFKNSKTSFKTFYDSSNENIGLLENTYEELMRLKKPADYWKERAVELKKEGDKFFTWLLIIVGFAVITLYLLLWLTPEGMQKTFFNNDRSLAIRWSVIYITFISFLFFAIKAIMKSMFSAYHLSRDAEERQRLTYVYLAMIKDASMEKEDRQLVMQSLFSRADTGLLKDDSSPTMPGVGGVIDKLR